MYEQYKHPNNDNLYAFIEVPVAMLSTEVPKQVPNSEVDGRQKTFEEFVLLCQKSLDETTALVLLASQTHQYGRQFGITEQDLVQWNTYLTNYGFGDGTWLTLEQYKTKLQSPAYAEETEV